MATVTVCDRCGAKAMALPFSRSAVVPKGAPSTDPVKDDVSVLFTLGTDKDLCRICFGSALKVALKIVNPS